MPSTLSYLLAVIIAAAPALALSFQGVQISGVTWQNGVQPSFLAFVPAATTAEACVKECQKTSGCSVVTFQSSCYLFKANAAVSSIADPASSAGSSMLFAIPGTCADGGLPSTYTTDTQANAPCTNFLDTTPSGINTRQRLARERRAARMAQVEAELA